jgi:hypothetical protein
MAIDSVVVTAKEVSEQMDSLWNITLNMVCEESSLEVLNQDFSIKYRTGQDIEVKAKEVQEAMQAAIDEWNAEQEIFDHAKLNAAVTYLNTALAP